jgi:diguanylate cyclase (GGDEF)-like protein
MNKNYKIVAIVVSLLVLLSLLLSFVNYNTTVKLAQKQIRQYSLTLSLDSIYADIQKQIIKSYIISSNMANNTFIKNWILTGEKNTQNIVKYLTAIKKRYNLYNTFLVSEKTKKYYTSDGLLYKLYENKKDGKWYFKFRQSKNIAQLTIDYNKNLKKQSAMLFVDYKIFDDNNKLLGVTGTIRNKGNMGAILHKFEKKYHLKVYIYDKKGRILVGQYQDPISSLYDIEHIKKYKSHLMSKQPTTFEHKTDDETYILSTRYMSELDTFILIEAKLSDFTTSIDSVFYFNLFVSLFMTILVSFIIIYIIRKYNKQLEDLVQKDSLTNIFNRRGFVGQLEILLKFSKRKHIKVCILFADIDDFKHINDTFGHKVGDKVLKRFAKILYKNTRESDLVARWGGEEFVIAFLGTNIDKIFAISEKICKDVEQYPVLIQLSKNKITGSFGLSENTNDEELDTLITQADEAMYKAKQNGKNQVIKF